MKNICLGFLSLFIIILASTTLAAHDLWLVPQIFRINPGDSVAIFANTGMDFPKSLSAVTTDRVSQFILVGKSIKENITNLKVQDNSLVAKYTFEKPGTYVIGAALKPKEIKLTAEEFNEYLLHDGLPDIYELRKKEGILNQPAVEHYSKYPKTIVQVGKKLDETSAEPLGFPIEIVPKVNPYELKFGDDLEVTVLFQGKPLSGAEIAWSYPGRGEEFAGSKRTDANGLAAIPLIKTGPYVIRLTYMEWVKKETHEWESYWTSLTFEVLPN
ncbi:MAG: DUF4198 domain-containing protein [Candidatus Aminicenantes bacterium]|nr:MAG: DUF4198 domain-containing protein [Candidatus Aminicenantes bacterium]